MISKTFSLSVWFWKVTFEYKTQPNGQLPNNLNSYFSSAEMQRVWYLNWAVSVKKILIRKIVVKMTMICNSHLCLIEQTYAFNQYFGRTESISTKWQVSINQSCLYYKTIQGLYLHLIVIGVEVQYFSEDWKSKYSFINLIVHIIGIWISISTIFILW